MENGILEVIVHKHFIQDTLIYQTNSIKESGISSLLFLEVIANLPGSVGKYLENKDAEHRYKIVLKEADEKLELAEIEMLIE